MHCGSQFNYSFVDLYSDALVNNSFPIQKFKPLRLPSYLLILFLKRCLQMPCLDHTISTLIQLAINTNVHPLTIFVMYYLYILCMQYFNMTVTNITLNPMLGFLLHFLNVIAQTFL